VGDKRRAGAWEEPCRFVGILRVGGIVAPYQGCRTPVKLSLSRDIMAEGQTPMGMYISRYL
jgi:hypothetical protein